MANVLTSLAADIYTARDTVGRELVGFIPSVSINSDASLRAAKGDTIRSHFTRKPVVNNSSTPSMTIPEGDDQTVDNKTFTINQVANVKIPWTGEDIKHVNNGSGFETIYGDQIAQAMRAITNAIELYLGSTILSGSSRAWGVAGTTPFASNFNEMANLAKILKDNGCPFDNQITAVINSTAGVNLRNLAQLQKVNESGDATLLRQGELLNLQGIRLKESAGVAVHVAGTGTGYLINSASTPAGTMALPVDTGSGTIVAADVITLNADTNKYIVGTALAAGVVTLNQIGLMQAVADNAALTVGAAYTGNAVFHKNAIELVVRPPALPVGGDAAVDRMTVTDPWSGMIYDIAVYKGYQKMMIDITTYYDVKVWKPDFVATLLG